MGDALHITVSIEDLLIDSKQTLLPIIHHIEGWDHADDNAITVQQLSGAMTNLVYKVAWQQHPDEQNNDAQHHANVCR